MIKVNSKVIIKGLHTTVRFGTDGKPVSESFKLQQDKVMIVEALMNLKIHSDYLEYNKCAKCIWYNTRNELQSEFINLELLTGL